MNKIKNNKKGFTLVELVVVIAILAILAAIAIPVVASTIKSSQVSSAKSNAQTIELAIKEAQAAIASGDNSVFPDASTGTITLADVANDKQLAAAMDETYTVDGATYTCVWNNSDSKVYFVDESGNMIGASEDDEALTDTTAISSSSETNVTELGSGDAGDGE